ncbi:hypothetical protein BvCmsSINP041_01600 [Escherichia coli]|nr:hypothetical protein BvCmsSINP041_01600 [Escherichia coli]
MLMPFRSKGMERIGGRDFLSEFFLSLLFARVATFGDNFSGIVAFDSGFSKGDVGIDAEGQFFLFSCYPVFKPPVAGTRGFYQQI